MSFLELTLAADPKGKKVLVNTRQIVVVRDAPYSSATMLIDFNGRYIEVKESFDEIKSRLIERGDDERGGDMR